jgi:hypothetical protein
VLEPGSYALIQITETEREVSDVCDREIEPINRLCSCIGAGSRLIYQEIDDEHPILGHFLKTDGIALLVLLVSEALQTGAQGL